MILDSDEVLYQNIKESLNWTLQASALCACITNGSCDNNLEMYLVDERLRIRETAVARIKTLIGKQS